MRDIGEIGILYIHDTLCSTSPSPPLRPPPLAPPKTTHPLPLAPFLDERAAHLLIDANGAQAHRVEPDGQVFEDDGFVEEDFLVEGGDGGAVGGWESCDCAREEREEGVRGWGWERRCLNLGDRGKKS